MFIDTADKNVVLFRINYFYKSRFCWNLFKKKNLLSKLKVRDVFLDILVSLTATMSKFLFLHFNKHIISSKFLFNEHA